MFSAQLASFLRASGPSWCHLTIRGGPRLLIQADGGVTGTGRVVVFAEQDTRIKAGSLQRVMQFPGLTRRGR